MKPLKHPIPKDDVGYLNHTLLAMVSIGRSTVNYRFALNLITVKPIYRELQIHRESSHGETGKGGPLWGLNASVPVWPNHGSFGAIAW